MLVIASAWARIVSPVSEIVWMISFGMSFLNPAAILKAAFPLIISKFHLSTWARNNAKLSKSTSKLPPKIPIRNFT